MCFRPAEIKMNECPKCGSGNKPIATVCAQCGAPLEMQKVDFDADQSKLDAANVSAPAAPKAPKAPGAPAPAATSAPGNPKL